MNVSLSNAYNGINTAVGQQTSSAQNLSNLQTPNNNVDVAKEVVNQIESKYAVDANADVMKTADKILGNLVDIVG